MLTASLSGSREQLACSEPTGAFHVVRHGDRYVALSEVSPDAARSARICPPIASVVGRRGRRNGSFMPYEDAALFRSLAGADLCLQGLWAISRPPLKLNLTFHFPPVFERLEWTLRFFFLFSNGAFAGQ